MRTYTYADYFEGPDLAHATEHGGILGKMVAGHDENHRVRKSVFRLLVEQVFRDLEAPEPFTARKLIRALQDAFGHYPETKHWGMALGVVEAASNSWRVWTIGAVYCHHWWPGHWEAVVRPHSLGQKAMDDHGYPDGPIQFEDVSLKLAQPTTKPDEFEYAEIARRPESGVALLGSAGAVRRVRTAAMDPSWDIASIMELLDTSSPRQAGDPFRTLVALVD